MANPSKRYPWVVEMMIDGKWYPIEAFHHEDEAEVKAGLIVKRQPRATVRYRDITKND